MSGWDGDRDPQYLSRIYLKHSQWHRKWENITIIPIANTMITWTVTLIIIIIIIDR